MQEKPYLTLVVDNGPVTPPDPFMAWWKLGMAWLILWTSVWL